MYDELWGMIKHFAIRVPSTPPTQPELQVIACALLDVARRLEKLEDFNADVRAQLKKIRGTP